MKDFSMDSQSSELLDKLEQTHTLEVKEYEYLIAKRDVKLSAEAARRALKARKAVYGTAIFLRGLIEVSNYCKNDCFYCGIRKSNTTCKRYRLTIDQILQCAQTGYELGFRTVVLQGGEDPWFTDERLCCCVSRLKELHPDCAVTISMGERSYDSYRALFNAGADRYLLRHETATREHYEKLHPSQMNWDWRRTCLENLRAIGFVVGCGFMVGSPFQTAAELACDLKFIESFQPEMCGIGPFIAHHATPFADYPLGSADETCFLLSLLRLIKPNILMPATTALSVRSSEGYSKGVLAGANVVMLNLSPAEAKKHYEIYEGKSRTDLSPFEQRDNLAAVLKSIGFEIVVDRGDPRK